MQYNYFDYLIETYKKEKRQKKYKMFIDWAIVISFGLFIGGLMFVCY